MIPGIPTTIKTRGVNITTIVYLRVLIIQTGSTIILMVVEARGDQIGKQLSESYIQNDTMRYAFAKICMSNWKFAPNFRGVKNKQLICLDHAHGKWERKLCLNQCLAGV